MNKINPLYFLAISLFLALLMIYKSVATENRIAAAVQNNADSEQMGKRIQLLQDAWKNPEKMQQRIDAVLDHRLFTPYIGKKENKAGVYHVEVNGISADLLDKLTDRLFSAPVALKSMQITRNSDRNVSLDMEFDL